MRSITERGDMAEFMANVIMADKDFTATRDNMSIVTVTSPEMEKKNK